MKHTFEMTWDQVDAIVISELQEAYRLNVLPNYDEGGHDMGPDHELVSSIETVLQYFMSKEDYEHWKQSIK